MASSPVSPQLEHLGDRRFSFYPPIIGIEHNEWTFVEANWSEILVRNVKNGDELWIPRAYIGDVSKVDEPVMIVGLKRELEYKGGLLGPHSRRVLTMPGNPMAVAPPREAGDAGWKAESGLSMRAALRSGGGTESRVGKLLLFALIGGLVLTFFGVAMLKRSTTGGTIEYQGVPQVDLGLTAQSDYFDIVRKLGPPSEDRWKEGTGERQYRVLVYPKNNFMMILMGQDREHAFYIGTKDSKGRIVHAVTLPGGTSNTEAILRTLPKF